MLRSPTKFIVIFCQSYSLLLLIEHESSSASEQDCALPQHFSISAPLLLRQGDHEWKWGSTQGRRHTTSSRGSQSGVKWPVIFLAISSLFWGRWKCHTNLMVLFLEKAEVILMTSGRKNRRLTCWEVVISAWNLLCKTCWKIWSGYLIGTIYSARTCVYGGGGSCQARG